MTLLTFAIPFPIPYNQQAPSTTVPSDGLSTVTKADTSTVVPNQTHVIQQKPPNRNETNRQWLYHGNVSCYAVVCVTNIAKLSLPCIDPHSPHFLDPTMNRDIKVKLCFELNVFVCTLHESPILKTGVLFL